MQNIPCTLFPSSWKKTLQNVFYFMWACLYSGWIWTRYWSLQFHLGLHSAINHPFPDKVSHPKKVPPFANRCRSYEGVTGKFFTEQMNTSAFGCHLTKDIHIKPAFLFRIMKKMFAFHSKIENFQQFKHRCKVEVSKNEKCSTESFKAAID